MPDPASQPGHTDLVAGGWIDRKLPPGLRPYAYLMRLDRPVGIWLLLLPGWWGIMAATRGVTGLGLYSAYVLILFALGAVIMRGAGCIINDLWDRDIDARVERTKTRPLASGALSKMQAFACLGLLLWLGLIILVQLSGAAIWYGIYALVLVALYPLAKRVTWYPQAMLGLTFNMGVPMGYAAIAGAADGAAWCLYLGAFFWTLGYDTIYAWQDREDDIGIGVKSTAVKFGDKSPYFVFGFYMAACLLWFAASFLLQASWVFYPVWAVAAFHLLVQLHRWKLADPESALRVFRSNRDAGIIIFLAFALGFMGS